MFKNKDISLADKEDILKAEMTIDYSDVDDLRKLSCEACLPDDANKLTLWTKYVNKEDINI